MSFGQGGPQWGPGDHQGSPMGTNETPDWAALAEASESRNKRRKWLMIGGGALATAAIGGIVAIAVVSANSNNEGGNKSADELPPSQSIPSNGDTPGPTFSSAKPPPPPDPKDFISSAKKDKAPLSVDTLFYGKTFTKGATVYKKGATSTAKKCSDAARGKLATILDKNGCDQVFRATYSRDGMAVTVGVAVFDTEEQASKAKQQVPAREAGNIRSLSGKGVPGFCNTVVCYTSVNSYGRYAYFTTAGFTNGKKVTEKDQKVFTIGKDIAGFAFQQIYARGKAQASAAAAG
ncbi:hypothetical protein [Streptomyces sp. NBC_01304]|uniref:hypothetical protein n=1 Tax=Streptomyces sp. NBC_01304 TaxID=2903818 RepID=UPI002E0DFC8C|nr:hypothetical protein OG430_20865 [Streptomyces sp. NBC_01304]